MQTSLNDVGIDIGFVDKNIIISINELKGPLFKCIVFQGSHSSKKYQDKGQNAIKGSRLLR